jgi:thioredoxin 1
MGWLSKMWSGSEPPQASFEHVSDESFAALVASAEKPIMLFLWSSTCPYCRKMAPNVKNVLARHRDELIGVHANTAEVPAIVQELDLRGVPATAFFADGRLVELIGGFRPEEVLDQAIAAHFGARKG